MVVLRGWDTSKADGNFGSRSVDIDVTKLTDDELAKIEAKHNQAMHTEPTWSMFGGVIRIGSRNFQVSP